MRRYVLYLCICFLYVAKAGAQIFTQVGCSPPYETLNLGVYNNELLYSRGGEDMCGVPFNGIGRWNGNTWNKFGIGIDQNIGGGILAFTTHNNELYVGGHFYVIGGKQTNRIAKWNGTQWDSVSSGTNGNWINALTSYNGKLYAGGMFGEIGGNTNVRHIAYWDGTSWQRLKDGIGGNIPEVKCMAVYKSELYVGGRFQLAGTTNAYYIARWDGIRWRSVGKGADYPVMSMVVDTMRNLLYVGGGFRNVDDTIPGRVAMWDGNNWHRVGDSSIFMSSGSVLSMEMYHGYLYAGGISARGLVTDTCMARWDGKKWEVIQGPNNTIVSLKTYNDELYIGGMFTKIGNDSIPYLARYYSPDTVTVGIRHEKRFPFGGDQEGVLLVYPNPSNNRITIFPIAIGTELVFEKLSVKDILGKEILFIQNPSKNSIDISSLEEGMYFLSATTNEKEVYNTTFIKE